MAWEDRIKEAAYTSPSGARIVFDFENVSTSFDKKTTNFEFPDANGTYVQDLGHTGNRYPLRIFFWGDDHDLTANEFETLLKEVGIGILEHPIYGSINVVPFGSINFRNDLKTAAGQTVIEITFYETIELIYPLSEVDPASKVLTAVDEFNVAIAESFETIISANTAVEQASFKSEYNALLAEVEEGLQVVANAQDDVKKQFELISDSINNGIDVLISDPLTLAFQTSLLIQSPARSSAIITARLDAYNSLLNLIITGDDAIKSPSIDDRNENEFHTNDLYASTYITGSILSVINNVFTTKVEAIEAAESITNQMNNLTAWRDDNFTSLSIIDDGIVYQQLQEAVALVVGFLVAISFTLKQERKIILESAHTVIDLISELYPADIIIDEELDFFIQSNNLTGSEILELPRGRDIVYYV